MSSIAGRQAVSCFLLAVCLYLVSAEFVSYWPFGVLEATLVMLGLFLGRVQRLNDGFLFGLSFGGVFFSFFVGCFLVGLDGQPVFVWQGLIFLFSHMVWGVWLWFWRVDWRIEALFLLFRCAVFLFFVLLVFSNSEALFEDQVNIALLEFLLLILALTIFKPGVRAGLLLLFFCLGGISLGLSNILILKDGYGISGWGRMAQIAAHAGLGWGLYLWLREDKEGHRWCAAAVLFGVFSYALILSEAWMGMADPWSYDWFLSPPLYQHIRHLGYFLCVGLVVSAWAVISSTDGRYRILSWLVYLLAGSMLLWSGGRGAFLASIGGGVTLMGMSTPWRAGRVWAWLLIGMLLAFVLSALFAVEHPGLGWLSALVRSESADSLNRLSSSRLWIWTHLLDYILQRPWFGWGGDGFRLVWNFGKISQAHNGLIQLLLEWGVVGTLLIGIPLGWLLIEGGRAYLGARSGSLEKEGIALGMGIVVSLLMLSMVDGVLYYGSPSAFLALGFALLVSKSSTLR
ncbi:O-antigen ligase family protein [Pseudomonas indica]|uniref:O-antigen ligase family protein n=1 Tax=Pseudomonas indica TaxID=137658 RepID=UPI003FD5CAE7